MTSSVSLDNGDFALYVNSSCINGENFNFFSKTDLVSDVSPKVIPNTSDIIPTTRQLKCIEGEILECGPTSMIYDKHYESDSVGASSVKGERLENMSTYRNVSVELSCTERREIEDMCDDIRHDLVKSGNECSGIDHCKLVELISSPSSTDAEDVTPFKVHRRKDSLHSDKKQSIKTANKIFCIPEQVDMRACSESGKIFMSSESLSMHLQSHLKIDENLDQNSRVIVCSHCDKKFTSHADLESHDHVKKSDTQNKDDNAVSKSHHVKGERKWACQTCEKAFRTSKALREHEVVHTGARDFPCSVCGKAFGTAANMRIHRMTHSDQRPFACLTCGAAFRQKDSLKVHVRKHTGERPFVCNVCNMTFDRNFTLKNHMLTHISEKSYVCSACGKAFSTRGGLNNHERLHFKDPHPKKERPPRAKPGTGNWVCDECGKIYSTRSNLRMHKKTHEPTQVFHICPVCSRSYKSRDSMEVHMRRHTENRPYKCTMCSRSFYRNYTLKLHILTHTGEKPHHCPIEGCIKSFAQSSSLSYHVRNHKKQDERKLNHGNGKRPYKKRKAFSNLGDEIRSNCNTITVNSGLMKDSETRSGADVNVTQNVKLSTDPLMQQNIIGNIVLSNTPDNSNVQPMLDISNNLVHQLNHALPSVWDDNNSIAMIRVLNGLNHVSQHESLEGHPVNLEMETQNCQQVQLMQFVPAETLPLLVNVPDNVLYQQDGAEKTLICQNMLIPHPP